MKKFFLILAVLPLTASTCSKEEQAAAPERTLTVNETSIAAKAEGVQKTLSVTADGDWSVYAQDKSWVSVSPSGGVSGTYQVNVTVNANDTYEARSNKLTFAYGVKSTEVSITQEAKEKPYVDPTIDVPEGYSLVWHDEFLDDEVPANGNDCLVNTANWRFENWAPGKVNNELQRYVPYGVKDGHHTAWVENGILNIQALKYGSEVISARMNTRASWKYGYMEARIKLPKGKGTWPAFWMMPDDQSDGWPTCGEIDIMEEVGVNPNYTSSSIHTYTYNHTKNTQKTKEIYTAGAEDDFHVYACEWTAESIKFYTDGKQFLEFQNDGKGDKNTWPFGKNFYITLNLAWGGDWGGWNGVNEAALPCTMQVDYVRVFQK